jgi:hypothetical protein
MVYKVVSDRAEPPYGARFTLRRFPIEQDALCLFQVGKRRILGRRFPGWIVRPGRWIRTSSTNIKCLGEVVPLEA